MDTNAVADAILAALAAIHARSYRNKTPQEPVTPYVVFTLDSAADTVPSLDYYLNIDIFDSPNEPSRAIEALADTIHEYLDDRVIINSTFNLHAALEQRQYISNTDLVDRQMVNLRFVCRVYFS